MDPPKKTNLYAISLYFYFIEKNKKGVCKLMQVSSISLFKDLLNQPNGCCSIRRRRDYHSH